MRLLLSLALILCTCVAQADDKHVLVVNDSGYYLMITPNDAAPRFEKIDVVIDVTKNGGGPVTPDPDEPTEDPIVQGAYDAAAAVGNKKDAEILGAVYTFFAEKLSSGEMSEDGLRTHFNTVRAVAERRLTGNWGAALKQFDEGMKTTDDLAVYFDKIGKGLGKYAGVSQDTMLSKDREDITGMEIIALIEAIVQLLKLLGIL